MSVRQHATKTLLSRLVGHDGSIDVTVGKHGRRQCTKCLCLIAPSKDHCECHPKYKPTFMGERT